MLFSTPASRLFGGRIILNSPPRGARQRFLKARFARAFHLSHCRIDPEREPTPDPTTSTTTTKSSEPSQNEDSLTIDYESLAKDVEKGYLDEFEELEEAVREEESRPAFNGGSRIEPIEGAKTARGDGSDVVDILIRSIRGRRHKDAYWLAGRLGQENESCEDALVRLPPLVFAEVVRNLDPTLVHEAVDPLDGLFISKPMLGHAFAHGQVDKYGVRQVYLFIFARLFAVVSERVDRRLPTPTSVFLTLFRLAGAASRFNWATPILRLLVRHRQATGFPEDTYSSNLGDPTVRAEFIKTRFLTEPLYYQFDPVRVRLRHLLLHMRGRGRSKIMTRNTEYQALQKLRTKVNVGMASYFRKLPLTEGTTDAMSRHTSRSMLIYMINRPYWAGVLPTEEHICDLMVASTRGGAFATFRDMLFRFYGVRYRVDAETGEVQIEAGDDGPATLGRPGSPVWPTERLLLTVMRALGANAHLDVAIRLVLFLSDHFAIPVPSSVWSEWFAWANVHGSKPAATEWAILGDVRRCMAPREAPVLFEMLTRQQQQEQEKQQEQQQVQQPVSASDRYYQPSLDDLLAVCKFLIKQRRLVEARDKLLAAKALFDGLVRRHEKALMKDVAAFVSRVGTMRPRASHRTETVLDHALFRIQVVCGAWLEEAGRASAMMQNDDDGSGGGGLGHGTAIPDFVADLWGVLPEWIEYPTPTGVVALRNPEMKASYTERAGPPDAPDILYGWKRLAAVGEDGNETWLLQMRRLRYAAGGGGASKKNEKKKELSAGDQDEDKAEDGGGGGGGVGGKVRQPLPRGVVAPFESLRSWSVRGTHVSVRWTTPGREDQQRWAAIGDSIGDVSTVAEVPVPRHRRRR